MPISEQESDIQFPRQSNSSDRPVTEVSQIAQGTDGDTQMRLTSSVQQI